MIDGRDISSELAPRVDSVLPCGPGTEGRVYVLCIAKCCQQDLPLDQEFLGHFVTGDIMWIHHFSLTLKTASVEWKHTISPLKKKFSTLQS
jgi:hypothetical protein